MGAVIEFVCCGGKTARGYEALAGDLRPAIVLLHEWWGLNDQICGAADRFARAGYNVIAPDLYGGAVANDAARASQLMAGLDIDEAVADMLPGAARRLTPRGGKSALVGFSLGGALSALAATRLVEFSAAVDFYGLPADGVSGELLIPFQGHFAEQDDWCTADRVGDFEAAVGRAGRAAELHRYDAAHAFCNERGASYDVRCAELSWDRMSKFINRHLG
jgi:carboxymethylenebutenolidase